MDTTRTDRLALAATIAFCEAVGIVPGYLTRDAFDGWYDSLEKPDRNPPNWIFAPVWTTLYLLMGVASHLVDREPEDDAETAKSLFALQLWLNATWTFVFFGERSILGGVLVIVPLWAAILATIVSFARVNRRAALLLVPYLIWTTFATSLNVRLWRLNR